MRAQSVWLRTKGKLPGPGALPYATLRSGSL
jgi:hypothetical protein